MRGSSGRDDDEDMEGGSRGVGSRSYRDDRDYERDDERAADRKDKAGRQGSEDAKGDARSTAGGSKRSMKDAETRRMLRWLSFARPKLILGFEHLSPAFVPTMGSKSRGISICFEKIIAWRPPRQILLDLDAGGYEISAQLSLSLFHLGSGTFFGSTWMGSPVPLGGDGREKLDDIIDFHYNEVVYLISRITDPSCIGVVEIVASKEDIKKKMVVAQYGCGWTMLNLFGTSTMPDIAEGHENVDATMSTFFMGSPRDLLLNNDVRNLASRLKEMSRCTLQHRVFANRKLLRAQRLVAENEAISRFDVIAGLVPKNVTPSGETKLLSCIGDEERVEGKNNIVCIPTKPSVAIPLSLKVADFDVFVPDRTAMESRLVNSVAKTMTSFNGADAQIISRTLKVGLHNGHTILGGDWQSYDLNENAEDRDLLTVDSLIEVHGFAPHELMGLVFLVEYEVGLPMPSQTRLDTQAMIKSFSSVRNGQMVTNVVLGSTIYLPYDGKSMLLRNSDSRDWTGIELKLRNDDVCSVFSPKPVFADMAYREDKAEQEGKDDDQDESTRFMNVSFTLTAVDAIRGEIEHEEQIAADREDSAATISHKSSTKFIDDDEDSAFSPRRSSDKASSSVRHQEKKPSSSSSRVVTSSSSRRRRDDDDDESYAESLVGGDSMTSSLRIDSHYYASGRERIIDDVAVSEDSPRLVIPRDKSSLLARSMQAPISSRNNIGKVAPRRKSSGQDGHSLLEDEDNFANYARPSQSRGSQASASVAGVREITRGAKARLGRYGFDGIGVGQSQEVAAPFPKGISLALSGQQRLNVDLELEMRDSLSLHDVTIQFAGYRAGNPAVSKQSPVQVPHPKSVYFSFQFYTCQPTRTEVMRLLPADRGQLCVLVRDDAHNRDEPPLALRYVIDTSTSSPTEPAEFAEYLAQQTLLIDVWDADSLILVGTCCVPLRRIMRQGKTSAKCALECDVVNADMDAQTHGGITSSVISTGGGMSGQVFGSVHIIVSNFGQPGRGRHNSVSSQAQSKTPNNRLAREVGTDLNWRVTDFDRGGLGQGVEKRGLGRPKNSVRAKPLSESAPELSEVLSEYRHSAEGSMRSMTALRGGEGMHTLTYDEVVTLFKRFKGTVKGTVQYSGSLMQLLDVPSYNVALKKIVKAYQAYGDETLLEQDMLKYADSHGLLTETNVGEYIRSLFEKLGTKYRIEEVSLLSHKLSTLSQNGTVKPQEIIAFCRTEAETQEWILVSKRLRRTVQDAYLVGIDVEQLLSDVDSNGDHYISALEFKDFLQKISKHGKLTARDITMTIKHFTSKSLDTTERRGRDPVSLKDVMKFFGKNYVGNLEVRLAEALLHKRDQEKIAAKLEAHDTKHKGFLSYEEVEAAFSELGVYGGLSHEQVRSVLSKVDASQKGQIKPSTLLQHLFGDSGKKGAATSSGKDDITAEGLLRLLLDKVQKQGGAVDEVFRHFDKDGDGTITRSELETGLDSLGIFANVPNWRAQLPSIVSKFDTSGDGSVQLKEFFSFLGVVDYAPNITQRLTKIFAAVIEQGFSLKDSFNELDVNKDGKIDGAELLSGLNKLGTFGQVSEIDINSVIAIFDTKNDKTITQDAFVSFFSSRVGQAAKDRLAKRAEKILHKFRQKMKAVRAKGTTLASIFAHFDKDHGGTISKDELSKGLLSVKGFHDMTEDDLQILISSMATSNSKGEVSLKDFETFVDPPSQPSTQETSSAGESKAQRHERFALRVRDIFRKAAEKGLSVDGLFAKIDKDGDGNLTSAEFRGVLGKLQGFEDVSADDINHLIDVLDRNGDGQVSLREFKDFLSPDSRSTSKTEEKPMSEREIFIRHLQRIGEADGGVDSLLAYMDDDEDGLISRGALMRLLKREDIFNHTLTEDSVEKMLHPMTTKEGNISVVSLLRFIDGKNDVAAYAGDREKGGDDGLAVPEYDFSDDRETRALEKKMRGLGRILAKKGLHVEDLFRKCDSLDTGMIRRTEFIEVLSKMGLYILEQGRVLEEAADSETDPLRRQQVQQVGKLKGTGGSYSQNAPRAARRLVMSGQEAKEGDFKEHLESMALVNWYRQSQKKLMLQRVLSHSLASSIRIYPRFAKTVFFEFAITNPFSHEERFIIDVNDPELRLVTAFDEWLHLRLTCRSATGDLGPEPVEAEMFDRDGFGNVQVVLLPHETLHVPFTFMTLVPYKAPAKRIAKRLNSARPSSAVAESKRDAGRDDDGFGAGNKESKFNDSPSGDGFEDDEEPCRTAEVRIISGSHGHVVSVLKVLVHPRPFAVHRTLRFFEPENSIMKRRIQLIDFGVGNMFPGDSTAASKYVHCVENDDANNNGQSNVVIEWGPSDNGTSLDMLLRYRCGAFPDAGSFYLIIFNDPYQSSQHEIWNVIVQSRQRLDVHGPVGNSSAVDLVIRGDKFARRVRAHSSPSNDRVDFVPETAFQLVPGAYNRVAMRFSPRAMGTRRLQVNLVDVDSKELVSGWILTTTATAPAVMRSYDVDGVVGSAMHKKIIFKNPWDIPRRFVLTSSDESIMRPRNNTLEVAPHGSTYLRLWFNAVREGAGPQEVYLFMNDEAGNNEEAMSFRVL